MHDQGQERFPKRLAMKKERKAKEKEKKIKYIIKVNGKNPNFFFSDINQSSKSYCQEQLRANSAHVQPG